MHKILVIEDDKINCLIYKQVLKNLNAELDFAYDGQEGIDKFRQKKYDLIILDLGLPKIDGLTVASLIRTWEEEQGTGTKVPIIVATADSSSKTRKQAETMSIDNFLYKPFDLDLFLSLVEGYMPEK